MYRIIRTNLNQGSAPKREPHWPWYWWELSSSMKGTKSTNFSTKNFQINNRKTKSISTSKIENPKLKVSFDQTSCILMTGLLLVLIFGFSFSFLKKTPIYLVVTFDFYFWKLVWHHFCLVMLKSIPLK